MVGRLMLLANKSKATIKQLQKTTSYKTKNTLQYVQGVLGSLFLYVLELFRELSNDTATKCLSSHRHMICCFTL